jgi:hypothetical protein
MDDSGGDAAQGKPEGDWPADVRSLPRVAATRGMAYPRRPEAPDISTSHAA